MHKEDEKQLKRKFLFHGIEVPTAAYNFNTMVFILSIDSNINQFEITGKPKGKKAKEDTVSLIQGKKTIAQVSSPP